MRTLSTMIPAVAANVFWSCFDVQRLMAQNHPAPRSLYNSSNRTKPRVSLGNNCCIPESQSLTRGIILAAQLPPLIQPGPKSCPPSNIVDVTARWHACPWCNAVELAGQLRIEEVGWRTPAPLLTTLEAQLIFHPAAKALAEIGDPAIPVVQPALDHGNANEHFTAVRVLCIIHTPKAKAVLRENLQHETDPDLQKMSKRAIGDWEALEL